MTPQIRRRTFLSSLAAFAAAPLALLRSRKTLSDPRQPIPWNATPEQYQAAIDKLELEPIPEVMEESMQDYRAGHSQSVQEILDELHRLPSIKPGDVTLGPRDAVYADARSTK